MKEIKLNLGCGEAKLEGFINIDSEPSVNPDLLYDMRSSPLPYENNSVDVIHWIHSIEHFQYTSWPTILSGFHKILKPEGLLVLAYPEWKICALNFINNFQGKKNFWRATLYGRQLYPSDFHISPVESKDLVVILADVGFKDIKHKPEEYEPHNTFLTCHKDGDFKAPRDQEDLINEEVFRHFNDTNI